MPKSSFYKASPNWKETQIWSSLHKYEDEIDEKKLGNSAHKHREKHTLTRVLIIENN